MLRLRLVRLSLPSAFTSFPTAAGVDDGSRHGAMEDGYIGQVDRGKGEGGRGEGGGGRGGRGGLVTLGNREVLLGPGRRLRDLAMALTVLGLVESERMEWARVGRSAEPRVDPLLLKLALGVCVWTGTNEEGDVRVCLGGLRRRDTYACPCPCSHMVQRADWVCRSREGRKIDRRRLLFSDRSNTVP